MEPQYDLHRRVGSHHLHLLPISAKVEYINDAHPMILPRGHTPRSQPLLQIPVQILVALGHILISRLRQEMEQLAAIAVFDVYVEVGLRVVRPVEKLEGDRAGNERPGAGLDKAKFVDPVRGVEEGLEEFVDIVGSSAIG